MNGHCIMLNRADLVQAEVLQHVRVQASSASAAPGQQQQSGAAGQTAAAPRSARLPSVSEVPDSSDSAKAEALGATRAPAVAVQRIELPPQHVSPDGRPACLPDTWIARTRVFRLCQVLAPSKACSQYVAGGIQRCVFHIFGPDIERVKVVIVPACTR